MTLPGFLKQRGYQTACVGKWHLGLHWAFREPAGESLEQPAGREGQCWELDYSAPVQGGPLELGFDEFFGIAGSLDMPPYVYLRNHRAVAIPTVTKALSRKGAVPTAGGAATRRTSTRASIGFRCSRAGRAGSDRAAPRAPPSAPPISSERSRNCWVEPRISRPKPPEAATRS